MVIKSKEERGMIGDIAETFDNLRKINMKLNPKKCSFGMEEGKFLGYLVTSEGIRANPRKAKAIMDMQSPRTLKEMQSLSGKLAALNRFLSRSAERSLPFFETLKSITKENKDEYRWTKAAKAAFQEMKRLIEHLPSLTTPVAKETLYVYLAAADEAVSIVLVAERKGKQCPVHYVSRTLNDAEKNYAPMEKLVMSLLQASRRLCRYFKAHPIKVITDQPLKQILNKTQTSGKLAKYSVELGAYNIEYIPRNSIKGQILAYFLSETPIGNNSPTYFQQPAQKPNVDEIGQWTLYTDGASNQKGAGAVLVLISPTKVEYTYALRLNFEETTNNEAEYEALLAGLIIATDIGVQKIRVYVDSKLVANQMNGDYVATNSNMIKYLAKTKGLIASFKQFSIVNIPRTRNQMADVLSKLATVAFNHLTKEVLVEVLTERSIEKVKVNTVVEEEGANWMTPIIRCLEEGIWPEDKNEARTLRMKINQYVMIERVLFKKSYLVPMLRCVGPLQANYVIREIHMGACGMHSEPRMVVAKAMRQGYYWSTMHRDAREEIRKCDSCQIYAKIPRLPKTPMTSIMAPWPFYQWGRDILGPLPQSAGKAKYVIVAIDYFTKWIEAKPLTRITGKEVKKFTWDNIVCRFGLPKIIVTDNGTQFVNDPFKKWCKQLEIQQNNTAVAHPQANGLVEAANKSLMNGIKTRLGKES